MAVLLALDPMLNLRGKALLAQLLEEINLIHVNLVHQDVGHVLSQSFLRLQVLLSVLHLFSVVSSFV